MDKARLSIGVFDSGMGGLTVLRALRKALPYENFIYLGDTARLPYGTKSAHTVRNYAAQMTKLLMAQEIKALVIACNTATTAALDYLKTLYPDIPVIGVVEPGAMAAASVTCNAHVLVLATETTIASRAYHQAIEKYLPQAQVDGQACSLLVALAEEGMVGHEISRLTLQHYLEVHHAQDTILLGCTHFPVFKDLLTEMLPHAHIVDSASATATLLKQELIEKQIQAQNSGQVQYLVTDAITRFCHIGEIFLAEKIEPHQVQLIDV
jgi:glutamate racemase